MKPEPALTVGLWIIAACYGGLAVYAAVSLVRYATSRKARRIAHALALHIARQTEHSRP